MNNKYKDGNYLLNYSLDNLNVIFNPNYVNNSINYIFNPLYVTLLTDMAVSGVFSLVGYGLSKYIMKKFPYSYTRGFNDFVESLGKKTMPNIATPICEKGFQKFLNDSLESVISSIPGIILELIDKD